MLKHIFDVFIEVITYLSIWIFCYFILDSIGNLIKKKRSVKYMSLSAFLNPIEVENKKVVVSERFVEDGKPVAWEIKKITTEQEEEIRKSCTKKKKNKNGIVEREFDENLFNAKLVTACVVYPDLQNVELQDHYHAMGAEELLKKMLTSGEYWGLVNCALAFNDFGKTLDDFLDEAKN